MEVKEWIQLVKELIWPIIFIGLIFAYRTKFADIIFILLNKLRYAKKIKFKNNGIDVEIDLFQKELEVNKMFMKKIYPKFKDEITLDKRNKHRKKFILQFSNFFLFTDNFNQNFSEDINYDKFIEKYTKEYPKIYSTWDNEELLAVNEEFKKIFYVNREYNHENSEKIKKNILEYLGKQSNCSFYDVNKAFKDSFKEEELLKNVLNELEKEGLITIDKDDKEDIRSINKN